MAEIVTATVLVWRDVILTSFKWTSRCFRSCVLCTCLEKLALSQNSVGFSEAVGFSVYLISNRKSQLRLQCNSEQFDYFNVHNPAVLILGMCLQKIVE